VPLIHTLIALVALLARWLWPAAQLERPQSAMPEPEFDWFAWESDQIQRGGYAFWFDHWRYEGQPGAYLDPTPEQRAKVFRASLAKAREQYGQERLNDLIAVAVQRLQATGLSELAAYERVKHLGQDPVRLAIDIAEGRRDPDTLKLGAVH
jgi:hypothetical protein